MKKAFIVTVILTLAVVSVNAQKKHKSIAGEDSLISLSKQISAAQDDSVKLLLNLKFSENLKAILLDPSTFEYPFDSLKTLGKIPSPDNKFRIYTWNMPFRDGTNRYFAILQIKTDKKNIKLIELSDKSDSIQDPETKILKAGNWYGTLYYKVIHTRSGPKDIYTLLGWNGLNSEKNRKLIEILTFDQRGDPVFGAQIFRKYKTGKYARIFFDYSAGTSMMLKLDQQQVESGKKWNASKRKYETVEQQEQMIICDHLVPVDSHGGKQVMAASDLYDGFIFRNGTWNFVTGIDARNR